MTDIDRHEVINEHAIRSYVHEAHALWSALWKDDNYPPALCIRYAHDTSEEGKWNVSSYHNRTSLSTDGAVLLDVVREHIERVQRTEEMKQLPSLLSAS